MQKSTVLGIVANYLSRHPEEEERLRVFRDYLETNEDLFGRKNFNGHITTSAIVFDSTETSILLIFHKFLQSHLQPGGHFEGDASLADSAAREVLEETGVSVTPHPRANGDHPIDIDAHWMPANSAKGEDGHWHFDFRYLFTSTHSDDFALQHEEVSGCGWHHVESDHARACFGHWCWPKLEAPLAPYQR